MFNNLKGIVTVILIIATALSLILPCPNVIPEVFLIVLFIVGFLSFAIKKD